MQPPAATAQSVFCRRLSAVALLLTEVIPELAQDGQGPAQSLLPGDEGGATQPLRLSTTSDIVLAQRTPSVCTTRLARP